jgi:chaperone BCS1
LGLSIYVITLSSPLINDDSLRELLTTARERGILLLEDVDSALGTNSTLTFSGLLNAIDGVVAQEGRLLFMTTNHVAQLNDALLRPGRVDVRCELSLCSRKQVQALFLQFIKVSS